MGGLDIVASNADVEHFGALESITLSHFNWVFHTNVAGPLFATQAAAAAMTRGGLILLTSSISVRIRVQPAHPVRGQQGRCLGDGAQLGALAGRTGHREQRDRTRGHATGIAAKVGALYTPPALQDAAADAVIASINAIGRLAEPDEIAAFAAVLLSPEASHLTGATMDASGAWMQPSLSSAADFGGHVQFPTADLCRYKPLQAAMSTGRSDPSHPAVSEPSGRR